MAQNVSELWTALWEMRNTQREYSFTINGIQYGKDEVVEQSAECSLHEEFGIGNAYIASLTLGLYAEDIPKGAEIKRFVRLVNGEQKSEWIPKGVFYANRRTEDDGYWQIEAFDGMRKASIVWEPDQSFEFPLSMPDAVAEFARIMGVSIDSRTVLNPSYTIDYPANDWTIRDELGFIAAAHGGNFVMSDVGELLLVPLISIPEATNYLVTERGGAITFGGVRILV
jgi:hypothetical protein